VNHHDAAGSGREAAPGEAGGGAAAPRMAHDIGIEIHGGRAIVLLAEGSRTPCARAMTFTTVADGQKAIEIRVVRAAPSGRPADVIGRFLLPGLRSGPRGEARIDIGLSLDREGLLRAWGVDRASGARQEACFAGGWALEPAARPQALAALFRRVDNELDLGAGTSGALTGAARRDRRAAWALDRAAADNERITADCELALATLAGEMESLRRSFSGPSVAARFEPRVPGPDAPEKGRNDG
jgi:hypothetical protein